MFTISADEELIDSTSAAKILRLNPKSLANWRQQGRGPRFITYSHRCVRYRLADIQAWLDSRAVVPSIAGEGVSTSVQS